MKIRKLIIGMIISILLLSSVQPGSASVVQQTATEGLLCGITLDVSNRYYSVNQIKKYINLASKSENGYLQLHLTGDQNVGIECSYLGQVAKEKYRRENGAYYNPSTGQSFLSKKQVKSILAYAKKKDVQIVPEIDMPGHVGGFEKLYINQNKKTNYKIFNKEYEGELAINHKAAITFAKKIYKEYAKLFKGCTYFHIGCDEFWSQSAKVNASYINKISHYLEKKGFCVWAWNDLFTKSNISKINKKTVVTYWSYDGDASSKAERKKRRKIRATFPALQKAGFTVMNYNSYYLYLTPSKTTVSKEDTSYAVKDAKNNWSLLVWDSDTGHKSVMTDHIAGACVSVWSEDSKGVKASKIYS
ncbi:family 20 glycosylhydrolase [Eubacterium oxidoreducens]|uniref:beta-N-acetylhexosaminidase n=1 Tax=Eubacterium oxidoreducens TaxID=1732 RepID=A0A1G6A447_EUBOX|nr:family 20 glycosylhydrolase [Eubacterium oxidoreducens]SDB03218.1 hexosaminidase [Eubacterium oxidoreducens]